MPARLLWVLDSLKEEHRDGHSVQMAFRLPHPLKMKMTIVFIREIPMDQDLGTEGYYDKNVVIEGNTYYGYYIPIMNDGQITAVVLRRNGKTRSPMPCGRSRLYSWSAQRGIVILFVPSAFSWSRALSGKMKETGQGGCPGRR